MGSAIAGFKRVHVGIFDDKAENIIKRYLWEDENGGTVNLNITGLAPDMVDMWASNKRVWMKKQGTNEVKSDMDIFNIPTDQLNGVLGREKDQNGTSWVGDDTRAPYVALVGESETIDGQPVYCALVKGTFSVDSNEFKTTADKEEAPEATKLSGDWMNRKVDGKSRVYGYHEGSAGSDAFMKLVFPGSENVTEEAGSSTTTSTPS